MTRHPLALLAACLMLGFAAEAQAQVGADLNISPKRVVFKPGDRTATVYIFNQGDETATYLIEMADRVMTTDGQINPLAADMARPAWSASDAVQYTPHRVTLPPKTNQAVRIRLTRPPIGEERRSHLTVTALPPEDTGLTALAASAAEGQSLSLKVIGLFSLSIPVIVREGVEPSKVGITEPSLVAAASDADRPRARFTVTRDGASSVYGDIEIYAGDARKPRLVGKMRGVAVYPEIASRQFSIPLTESVRPSEPLRVVYRDDDQRPGSELATVSFAAP